MAESTQAASVAMDTSDDVAPTAPATAVSIEPSDDKPKRKRRGFTVATAGTATDAALLPTPGATATATEDASAEDIAAYMNSKSAPKTAAALAILAKAAGVTPALEPLTPEQQQKLTQMKAIAMQQTVQYRQVLDHQRVLSNPMLQQQDLAAKQRAYTLMGRVYVGSLYYSTTGETLTKSFEPYGVIRTTDLPWDNITGAHKGYAFVEYDCPEAANMAIAQMNGQMVDGRAIKVGRPNSAPQAAPLVQQMMDDVRNKTRVYVASIHSELSESDIKSVFEAFGEIKSCLLCPDPLQNSNHRGYGFIEYTEENAANEAVAAMNLFDLGGQYLRVCKAITLPAFSAFLQAHENNQSRMQPLLQLSASAAAAAAAASAVVKNAGIAAPTPVTASASATGTGNGAATSTEGASAENGDVGENASLQEEDDENIAISGTAARYMMMEKLNKKKDVSPVVILRNMVDKEDIDESLEEEVKEECEKHGSVARVLICEETDETTQAIAIKIFVHFDKSDSALECIKALDKRWFGGKQVAAESYDEARFLAKDFAG